MASKTGVGLEVVRDYLERFPKAAITTLAKKAYKENKSVWTTWNACYSAFRRRTGTQGAQSRTKTVDKSHYREPSTVKGFASLPEGLEELEEWNAVQVNTTGRWLVMSDIHTPYHSKSALHAIWTLAKQQGVKGVLLNGDIADCFAISHWLKDPRKRKFWNEIQVLREFFASLRGDFPKAEIIWKWGNHEERYDVYMQLKAPELLDVPEFDYGNLSHAEKYGISVVRNCQPVKLGKLWTLHGHEYKFNISNPVNPARGLFLRSRLSTMCGHMHQTSQHSEKDLADYLTSCWSTGALCSLRPRYAPLNKWNHGAAMVELFNDGAYSVNNYRIVDGKIWS